MSPSVASAVRGMLGLVLGASASCFSEGDAGDAMDSSASTATGGECSVGARGCPCTGGGGCDAGLECHAPSGLCLDPECERGSEGCGCLDGQCVAQLECRDELCQAIDATTSTGADSSSTTTADTGGGTTLATNGEDTVVPESCTVCVTEAWANECSGAHADCVNDENALCGLAAKCGFGAMITSGLCCPPNPSSGSTTLYNALLVCTAEQCEAACGDIEECPTG